MPNELEFGSAISAGNSGTAAQQAYDAASDWAFNNWKPESWKEATGIGRDAAYNKYTNTLAQSYYDKWYNANEAEKARAWSKMMADTAYQRTAKDLQAAGINPLYMFMGSGGAESAPSGASASGSDFPGVRPNSDNHEALRMLGSILFALVSNMGKVAAATQNANRVSTIIHTGKKTSSLFDKNGELLRTIVSTSGK